MNKNIIIAILVIIIIAIGAAFVVGKIGKTDTKINIINNETFQNGEQVVIELKDAQGNALSGKTVNITYNKNETYTITTDQNGKCYLTISGESAGKYDIEAKFAGDDKYNGCSATTTITITDEAPDHVGKTTGDSVSTVDKYNNKSKKSDDGTYYLPQYEITVRRSDNVIVAGPAGVVGLTLSQFYEKMNQDFSKVANETTT